MALELELVGGLDPRQEALDPRLAPDLERTHQVARGLRVLPLAHHQLRVLQVGLVAEVLDLLGALEIKSEPRVERFLARVEAANQL